jgi:hypothetical protein
MWPPFRFFYVQNEAPRSKLRGITSSKKKMSERNENEEVFFFACGMDGGLIVGGFCPCDTVRLAVQSDYQYLNHKLKRR